MLYASVVPVLCKNDASRFMEYFCEELCFEVLRNMSYGFEMCRFAAGTEIEEVNGAQCFECSD